MQGTKPAHRLREHGDIVLHLCLSRKTSAFEGVVEEVTCASAEAYNRMLTDPWAPGEASENKQEQYGLFYI